MDQNMSPFVSLTFFFFLNFIILQGYLNEAWTLFQQFFDILGSVHVYALSCLVEMWL